MIVSTLGRLIYNRPLPQNLGFVNRSDPANAFKMEIDFVITKKELGQIIDRCIKYNGFIACANMLDEIKALGYKYSTRASFSISVYDMNIPARKCRRFLPRHMKQVEYHQQILSARTSFRRGTLQKRHRSVEQDHERSHRQAQSHPRSVQPDQDHGRLRCAWFHAADASACRNARTDVRDQR